MKLLHLADLHIGKRVNGFSMLEDQSYILNQIIDIVDNQQPDAVLIAGDVYDKPVPAADAVQLLDDFLVQLSRRHVQVCMISGNHDSAERIAFGGRLMSASGIHLAPVYHGAIEPVTLTDSFGSVHIYLIPFLRPANVRHFHADTEINSYTNAMRTVIENISFSPAARNVAVVHQFVTGSGIQPETCESEEHTVGGLDQVDASVFAPFDYVALGHLHGPQKIGRDTIRYGGSPLKYSFSEVNQKKSVTIITMQEKGCMDIHQIPLRPKRDMELLRGAFASLTAPDFLQAHDTQNYFKITLTDEEDIPNALTRLRECYPNMMLLEYDNKRTRAHADILGADHTEQKSPLQLFDELYEKQNGQPMSDAQRTFTMQLIREIWEDME
ncbi:MAG: exonuclease SbcCD subunit D [Eubacteriales bacterium]|nr:exonuclease SbcCD subunit D [Eubacteriales bacterium]